MKVSAIVAVVAAATVRAEETSPVAKVLDLLSGLQSKIIGEGKEAQKAYDDFAEWCEDTAKNLQYEVKTGKDSSDSLQASIAEEVAQIQALTAKVEELAASLAADSADLKAATEIRTKEAADFAASEKELMEVVDTLGRAIGILEREMKKGGASMMQLQSASNVAQALSTMVEASVLSSADGQRLTALVQSAQETDDDSTGAPAASVYEGHSSGILDVLGGLLEKAQTQLDDARKTESTASNNFSMLKQSLEDNIKFSNQETDAANKGLAKTAESKASNEGDLEVTTKDLSADTNSLSDLHQNCMKKAEEFEAETKSRAEELAALAAAKKVIGESTGGAAAQAYSFVQINAKISSSADLTKFEAVHMVRDLAKKLDSVALTQLASRLSSAMRLSSVAGGDIFGKIKGLIADMIEKLSEEAQADATEKAFCDKELAYTRGRKGEKENEISKLSTSIDQASARSAQLKEEVATLQKELSDLASSQASWTKFRGEEKTVYDREKAEMEEGLNGIKTALKILRDYYAQKQENAAEGAATGIIGLLEVCESDFSKGLAELISTEESAVATFEAEIKDIEIERATKEQDSKYKTKEHVSLDKAVTEMSSDRAGVQTELNAINTYLGNLEGRCIAKAATYEAEVKRRTAEIAGLKDALEILEGEGVSFSLVQSKRSLRGVRHHA